MRYLLRNLFVIGWIFISTISFAQVSTKHPRVVELEKNMTKDAMDFLKGRFPNHPFLVSVSIDPLHREKKQEKVSSESLPYYEIADADITDEWDDPSLSLATLQTRVRKISVTLSIPSTLSEDEVSELSQSIVNNLGLIQARDSVEVRKRTFSSNETKDDKTFTFLGWGAFAWLALMLGLIGVVWVSANKMSSAFATASAKVQSNAGANGAPLPNFAGLHSESSSEKNVNSNLSGDIRFNDPIKTREVISSSIQRLESRGGFPTLDDMLSLHKMAEENPASLGALISEFPPETARKIFSFSFGNDWLEAMHAPGEVDYASMALLNKLIRTQKNELEQSLQELLICIWRLEDKQSSFLKSLPRDEAMFILSQLPASLSLNAARIVFPGAWAALLDNSSALPRPSSERIQALIEMAKETVPLRDRSILNTYKKERELLTYLKTCDSVAEKEIYTASIHPEMLESIRPPFYKVYELKDEQYDKLVPMVSIEEWALVFFNTSRLDRKSIEKRFSEKQKFRYLEILRSLDARPPSPNKVGEVRQKIGRIIQNILKVQIEAAEPAVAATTQVADSIKQAS